MFSAFRRYFLYFLTYSVIGWLYEVFLEVVVYGWGFSNRGVLFGPYCPVYGVGTLIFLFLVYPIIAGKKGRERLKYVLPVFILCMVAATAVEVLASYVMELAFGGWAWDYTRYALNFQGRIALNPSIRFGIGGVFFLYAVQPLIEKAYKNDRVNMLAIPLMTVFAIDIIYTLFFK